MKDTTYIACIQDFTYILDYTEDVLDGQWYDSRRFLITLEIESIIKVLVNKSTIQPFVQDSPSVHINN